jgi:hypothetical protein
MLYTESGTPLNNIKNKHVFLYDTERSFSQKVNTWGRHFALEHISESYSISEL